MGEPQENREKKKKIGEILLEEGFITPDILNKALAYQEQYGGNITQFLLAFGYITQEQLVQCLCSRFGVPYLPLKSYDVSDEIIRLVPADIATEYWLIPIERIGDSLTVVMADPFDARAIQEVEEITGCKVRSFVGILSEIIRALEVYYKVIIKDRQPKVFINTKGYKGFERRRSVRFATKIEIYFPAQGYYNKSLTKNLSRDGFLFDSECELPLGSIVTLEIYLPKEISPLPIVAVTQVIRANRLGNKRFEIAVKTIKILKEELSTLIEYASASEKK